MRDNRISEGHPVAPNGWLSRAALIQTPDSFLHLQGPKTAHKSPLITSVLCVYMRFLYPDVSVNDSAMLLLIGADETINRLTED